MNPPKIIIAALCFILSFFTSARAQEMDKEISEMAAKLANLTHESAKKKLTVLDFTDLQGNSSELGKYIAEQLTVDLVMVKKNYSVLDRANLRKILAEHKLTATGLIDPENAKKLGQFSGVDALVLGTVTPKGSRINLTAKIITTDTAEIVGAAKAEFNSDETIKQLLTQAAKADESTETAAPAVPAAKPFGDLQARVESIKLLPNIGMGLARLTLIITNASASKTYGVALEGYFYDHFNLSNSRGDEFKTTEISGIDMGSDSGVGTFRGKMTDILPRTAITIVSKSQVAWSGKSGDYRPYRLQTMVIFGTEENGRYQDLKKHNLVIDIK